MALVLTLGVGKDFYVEGARVTVVDVISPTCFSLQLESGEMFHVTADEWKEILPGVLVQSALEKSRAAHTARVAIEAPGLRILRGESFRSQG